MTAHARATPSGPPRAVWMLLGVAVAVSVVHYADNVLAYDAYPQPDREPAPSPSRAVVAISWFGFTAIALAGAVLLRRGHAVAAAACLAAYSGSGLVGLGHYAVEGATGMPWWRQAHIVADILCGAALLAVALWLARRRPLTEIRA